MSLLSKTLCSFLAMGAVAAAVSAADEFPPKRDGVECTPREGLPNFFSKLEKGGDLKVAYLGGSITAQAGWRVKSLAFFNKSYPNAKCSEINASIGGTGSNLGVLRIDHDVFQKKPDLLFVEFAVNDAGASPTEIVKSMEGIVRKTWTQFPDCDICFVYTFTSGQLEELKTGKLNRSAATMEVVADKYGIPTIPMGLEAVRLAKEGKLVMSAPEAKMDRVSGDELNQKSKALVGEDGKIPFSKDGVHPYTDTGHQLYQEAIERSIPLIKAASKAPASHAAMPEPLDKGNYSKTVMLQMDSATLEGPWTKLPSDKGRGRDFSNRMDSLWKAEPGASLSFKFKGSFAKIYDLVGSDCGKIEIVVDGGKPKAVNRIDGYCTYHRLAMTDLCSGLDPQAVHEVSVKVLPDQLDKAKILFEHNRADLEKNPDKYAGSNWYAGAIFIDGEIVK